MKLKNKIYTLLSVFTLVGLTHSLTLKDLNAVLTAPASFDFSYRQSNVDTTSGNNWAIKNNGGTAFSTIPAYTQTYDGQYYDYVQTSPTTIVSGLTITHTFNNSSTSWSNIVSNVFRPNNSADFIGSNSTSGTGQKFIITFSNQTNKNYRVYLDNSSTGNGFISISVDGLFIIGGDGSNLYSSNTQFDTHIIYSYSTFIYYSGPSFNNTSYFDAWYLQDLGVSDSYNGGYETGETDGYSSGYSDGLNNNPNILLNGFQAMVGILVNFALMILNLDVFGVSLLGVFGVISFFVGIIWFLKILRG
jgi:hypothetical protein